MSNAKNMGIPIDDKYGITYIALKPCTADLAAKAAPLFKSQESSRIDPRKRA